MVFREDSQEGIGVGQGTNEMRYPMFREVVQDIEDAEETEETKCSMCQKSIWIPKEYFK